MGNGCSASPAVIDSTSSAPTKAPPRSSGEDAAVPVTDAAPPATPVAVTDAPASAPASAPAAAAPAAGGPKTLVTLHYNDVYNLEEGKKEPVGGAARFAGMVFEQKDDPLVLFSGDALNPSMASTFFKGKQMIPVLNLLKTKAACVGNHDLDFGVENLQQCMKESTFPWLLANILDKDTKAPLAGARPTAVLTHAGVKVGVVGLAEQEWIATLVTVTEEQIDYEDFVACGRRLAVELRERDGCDVVVALTHMREPNDERLAREAPEFDAVLGGHDHHYVAKAVEPHGTPVLKSGTEFRWATKTFFQLSGVKGERPKVTWETIDVTKAFPEHPEAKRLVDELDAKLGDSMDIEIGETMVELEGRFLCVRTRETNLGNLVCDLLRAASGADVCILNGGTLRSDAVHKPGKLLFRDLVNILPMLDETCVLEMKGAQVTEALENACSQYPKLEGRFAQVSGLRYTFDAAQPPGARVVSVEIPKGTPLDAEKLYKVNTKEYLSKGKDGYDAFLGAKVLRSGEEAPIIPTTMRNHLLTLDVLNVLGGVQGGSGEDLQARVAKTFRTKSKTATARMLLEAAEAQARAAVDQEEGGENVVSPLAGRNPATGQLCLAPCVDGRIVIVNPADESGMM